MGMGTSLPLGGFGILINPKVRNLRTLGLRLFGHVELNPK